ncbi:hypothetical protein [Treponema putidum]|uniref:Uncharacterized protein n=1 Tax=Treponema putidum TaxID=221027 RepID=A0AAE9SIW6_9SPIR|nr:hypothetical protein [Treponema putidum]AIN94520.1 hypothetical protein JO40_10810 [Treponema putidum]TWI78884.1 hypothetical protein JM98_00468 [Treponema putidum]UTY28523.1 hypothetical protein E4N76_05600 [Treponema putidum]UTY30970.1 hypothetical protein E4N75_05075 [Treponema putidum]UTY33391.1 hypothetical protein E4N74_04710 [Treponema putidum]
MDSKDIKPYTQYKRFTIRFLDRSIRFLSASVFIFILFYVLSSSQDFLDSSLFLILNVLMNLCVLLIIFTFASIVFKAYFIIRYKETKYILKFIIDIFLCFLSIILAVIFSFLVVVAQGNA